MKECGNGKRPHAEDSGYRPLYLLSLPLRTLCACRATWMLLFHPSGHSDKCTAPRGKEPGPPARRQPRPLCPSQCSVFLLPLAHTALCMHGPTFPHWSHTSTRMRPLPRLRPRPGSWAVLGARSGFDTCSQAGRLFVPPPATSLSSGQAACLPGFRDLWRDLVGMQLLLLLLRHERNCYDWQIL